MVRPRPPGVKPLQPPLQPLSPFALWLFLSDEEAGVEEGMAMGLASALGGFKNAKDAKNAKNANPRRLAFLADLGCRDASEFLETLPNLLKLVRT